MKRKKKFLVLESGSGYAIKDQDGNVVTLEDARKLFESGKLDDWNMAFDRLARHFHFDLEATKQYYAGKEGR